MPLFMLSSNFNIIRPWEIWRDVPWHVVNHLHSTSQKSPYTRGVNNFTFRRFWQTSLYRVTYIYTHEQMRVKGLTPETSSDSLVDSLSNSQPSDQ